MVIFIVREHNTNYYNLSDCMDALIAKTKNTVTNDMTTKKTLGRNI